MRSGEEKQFNASVAQRLPIEGIHPQLSISGNLRKEVGEFSRCAGLAREQQRLGQSGVVREQARQLKAGITGGPSHRGLERLRHQASISRMRRASRSASCLCSQMIKMVSSPAMLPSISSQASASSAAATGCALPTLVFSTSWFCASRTLRTNSRTRRCADGNDGSVTACAGNAYPFAVLISPSPWISRDSVAWVTRCPWRASDRRKSSWLAMLPVSINCRINCCLVSLDIMHEYAYICINILAAGCQTVNPLSGVEQEPL